MTSRIVPVKPFDLVIFGGTGDLAYRKIFPALFHRFRDRQFGGDSRIVGASRRPMDRDAYRAAIRAALLAQGGATSADAGELDGFLATVDYIAVDGRGDAGWPELRDWFSAATDKVRGFYLATAPDLFGTLAARLAAGGLVTPEARIIVEKPIGTDGASAEEINDALGAVFAERQIFRIDHYLGKETVQNLLALRFANILLEPLWNSHYVDHVQITVAEALGVGGRGAYYDRSGALRDMVQNHLLQLLCLVAMEPPASLDADAVRDEKLKVLRALVPIDAGNAAALTVRGQYRAGASNGGTVPGYADDSGVADSRTETFVALKATVSNWRWSGVPFYLRTGKRLLEQRSEIVVVFRPVPHLLFQGVGGHVVDNRLTIRLQPDEGIKLWLTIKEPGPGGMRLKQVPLDMSFAQAFNARAPEAYERLLMDVIRGNATLFMRRDEVRAAWAWIDPIREAWAQAPEPPRPYVAGSWGPAGSVALIERDGRTWNEEFA
ncbi:MAG: glucose-6-phosphate dehydrogenase [Pseudomonadota bacterium]